MANNEYELFKSKIKVLEQNKKYYFMKRYYLFLKVQYAVIALIFVLTIGYVLFNTFSSISLRNQVVNDHSFVSLVQGNISFKENSFLKNIQLRKTLQNNVEIDTGGDGSCLIKLKKNLTMTVSPDTQIKIVTVIAPHNQEKTITVTLTKGEVTLIGSESNPNIKIVLETPASLIMLGISPIQVRAFKGGYYTKVIGECQVIPKSIYTLNINKTPKEKLHLVMDKLRNIKIHNQMDDLLIVPRFIDISQNDYITLSTVFEMNNFDVIITKLFFSGKKTEQ